MVMSPSERVPLAALPSMKNVSLTKTDRVTMKVGDDEELKEMAGLRLMKGYHKRGLSGNDPDLGEDQGPAKRARKIDNSDGACDIGFPSVAERFANFPDYQFLGGKSPQIRPMSSGSHTSVNMFPPLGSPSMSASHSRTSSTSTESSGGELADDEGTEGGELSSESESGEMNATQNTVMTVPDDVPLPAPVYSLGPAHTLPHPPRTQAQDRQMRDVAHKLRVMMAYAQYKINTQQVDVPLDRLEIRSVPRNINKPFIHPNQALDRAINARWEQNKKDTEARSQALASNRTPLPLAPVRRTPAEVLRDLGFGTEESSDEDEVEQLPLKTHSRYALRYNYYESRSEAPYPRIPGRQVDGSYRLIRAPAPSTPKQKQVRKNFTEERDYSSEGQNDGLDEHNENFEVQYNGAHEPPNAGMPGGAVDGLLSLSRQQQ